MNRITTQPKRLTRISDLEVGNSCHEALVPRGVEKYLGTKLIARQFGDTIVSDIGKWAKNIIVITLDHDIT